MEVRPDVQAGISRYLLEVSTYLAGRTPQERRELLADLEAHIHEALVRRGHEPTLNDLAAVLAEMASPESYAAPADGRTPIAAPPPRDSRATLALWALGLFVGGIVLFFVMAIVIDALRGKDALYAVAAVLLLILELIALALGILSWRERAGKVATLGVAALVVLGGACALVWLAWPDEGTVTRPLVPSGTEKKGSVGVTATVGAPAKKNGEAVVGVPDPWIDLLAWQAEAKEPWHTGSWLRSNTALSVTGDTFGSKMQLPVVPQGDYELELQFTKSGGGGGTSVILPVPDSSTAGCLLILGGWNNTVSGLDMVNRKPAWANETNTKLSLTDKHPYTLLIKVTQAGDKVTIDSTLDGSPCIKWSGTGSALWVFPQWALQQPKCIGLGVDGGTTVAFTAIRLRMLTGQAVPLEKFVKDAAPVKGGP